MLRVKTYLAPSTIHGIGVYTCEDVLPGSLIWSYEENFDRRFSAEEFKSLSPAIVEYYQTYGYQSRIDHYHYLPFDNDRFMNHCDFPNVRYDRSGNFVAASFIAKGEELTCDYREFDEDWEQYSALMHSGVEGACAGMNGLSGAAFQPARPMTGGARNRRSRSAL